MSCDHVPRAHRDSEAGIDELNCPVIPYDITPTLSGLLTLVSRTPEIVLMIDFR